MAEQEDPSIAYVHLVPDAQDPDSNRSNVVLEEDFHNE